MDLPLVAHLTAEQARMLFAEIVMAVRRHVTDRQTLAAISADFARQTDPRLLHGVEERV